MKRTKENVKSLIDEGKSVREIAEVFGITYTPMRMWMKKHGLSTDTSNKKWSNEQLVEAFKTSSTKAEVLRKIGLQVRPGNYTTLDKYIDLLGIDISHLTGKAHGTSINPNKKELSEILVVDSTYPRGHLKKRLLDVGLLKNTCQKCGLSDKWNDKDIVMILDHINGINNDNRIENLRMLCPNCNSQTSTFCRRKPTVAEID